MSQNKKIINMVRIASVRRVVTLVAVLAVSAAMAAAATPGVTASAASALVITQKSQPVWAGYSAYPVRGYIDSASAIWTVPKVSCKPLLPSGTPRAAVWVGTWGGITSMQDGTAWLPQIGTESDCNKIINGHLYLGASYWMIWEMFTWVKGGGNAIQYGFRVSPGDQMSANVILTGPYTSAPAKRHFQLQIEDDSTRQFANIAVTTNKPVAAGDIVREGGGIVEDNGPPTCVYQVGGLCVITTNGLADFYSTPVQFSYVGVDSNIIGGSGGYDYFMWDMRYNGQLLAVTEPLYIRSYGGGSIFDYTIAWLRQS